MNVWDARNIKLCVVALGLEVNLRKIWDFCERNCCVELRSHKIDGSLFWNNDVWVPIYTRVSKEYTAFFFKVDILLYTYTLKMESVDSTETLVDSNVPKDRNALSKLQSIRRSTRSDIWTGLDLQLPKHTKTWPSPVIYISLWAAGDKWWIIGARTDVFLEVAYRHIWAYTLHTYVKKYQDCSILKSVVW